MALGGVSSGEAGGGQFFYWAPVGQLARGAELLKEWVGECWQDGHVAGGRWAGPDGWNVYASAQNLPKKV